MRYHVREGVRVEEIDGDAVVLDEAREGVHRVSGLAADALRLASAGVDDSDLSADLRVEMNALIDAGIVERDGWSRRKMLAAGGVGVATGLTYLSLPSPAGAATSPTGAAPGPPTFGTISTTQTSATVNYTAPTTGGAADYFEYRLDAGPWVNVGLNNPFVINGLTANTTYTIELRGQNGGGAGNAASTTFMTLSVPTAPAITSVATTSTTASISYTAPTNNGGSTITGYQYSLNGGSTWSTTQAVANPLPVSGLTQATTYQFAIRAVNANGAGDTSNVVSKTTSGSQTFNTTDTFTVPAGVTAFTVQAWGAGGGGGGGNGTRAGGGGGGGGYRTGTVTVTQASYPVTVGGAGSGRNGATVATAGGTSSVSTIEAFGGAAGAIGSTSNAAGGGGSGGTSGNTGGAGGQGGANPSAGNTNGGGGGGGEGARTTGTGGVGSGGANSSGGAGGSGGDGGDGGAGQASNTAGSVGTAPGGGGGGGGEVNFTGGGDGGAGRVTISWT